MFILGWKRRKKSCIQVGSVFDDFEKECNEDCLEERRSPKESRAPI